VAGSWVDHAATTNGTARRSSPSNARQVRSRSSSRRERSSCAPLQLPGLHAGDARWRERGPSPEPGMEVGGGSVASTDGHRARRERGHRRAIVRDETWRERAAWIYFALLCGSVLPIALLGVRRPVVDARPVGPVRSRAAGVDRRRPRRGRLRRVHRPLGEHRHDRLRPVRPADRGDRVPAGRTVGVARVLVLAGALRHPLRDLRERLPLRPAGLADALGRGAARDPPQGVVASTSVRYSTASTPRVGPAPPIRARS
jgi:hypothetical protein